MNPLRTLTLAVGLALVTSAVAQAGWWTVQTVALRQVAEAETEAARLRQLGFSAYTERTLRDGLEFIRVRVGCTDSREVAEAWSQVLLRGVTGAAVPVPINGWLPLTVPCVAVDIGFRKPQRWALVSQPSEPATFVVTVAGVHAYLRYQGEQWQLGQGDPPLVVPDSGPARDPTIVPAQIASVAVVRGSQGLLCPGRLLAVVGAVAIIEWQEAIIACYVVARG